MKFNGPMANYQKVMNDIADVEGVIASTPFIYSQAMLKNGGHTSGVVLRGMSTDTALNVISLGKMQEGGIDYLSENQRSTLNLEREKLAPLKQMADKVIDTTSYNVHQLKDVVQRHFISSSSRQRMIIHVSSFGYRYGVPADADIVLDVRFLPNPYFVDELKYYDGHHPLVRDYVLESDESKVFIRKLFDMMAFLIPLYEKEGKARLNIALGCTGGRHRSVVMVNQLGSYFSDKNYIITINHRDITKS